MGAEEDAEARRERLKALRAEKEASVAAAAASAAAPGDERIVDKAEDEVEKVVLSRKERLKVLREAKKLHDTPDNGQPPQNTQTAEDPRDDLDVGANQSEHGAEAPADVENDGIVDKAEDEVEKVVLSRKERLKILREAKKLHDTPDDGQPPQNTQTAEEPRDDLDIGANQSEHGVEAPADVENDGMVKMKFRNYLPHDEKLQKAKLQPTPLSKFEDPSGGVPAQLEKDENPFEKFVPQKPNEDLRRDVEKRLAKLEKRTQKAIYEIALELQREREAQEVDNMDSS